MGLTEWALLVLLSVLWGGSFYFVAVGLKAFPPFTLIFLRVFIGALGLLVVIAALGLTLPRESRIWRMFALLAITNNIIPFALIAWGQIHIASGLAAILNSTTPIFTLIVAHILTKDEKISLTKLTGILLGFCGVVIMLGTQVLFQHNAPAIQGAAIHAASPAPSWVIFAAHIAILGAALSYGFAGVYSRRFQSFKIDPIVLSFGQVACSSFLLVPLVAFIDQPWTLPAPSREAIGAAIGLGLLATTVAYYLYFLIIKRAGATNGALVTMLIPASAIILGWLFLGERLALQHYIGMICIVVGLLVLDGRIMKLFKAGEVAE